MVLKGVNNWGLYCMGNGLEKSQLIHSYIYCPPMLKFMRGIYIHLQHDGIPHTNLKSVHIPMVKFWWGQPL